MMFEENVAKKIKDLRKEKNLTQKEFAKLINTTQDNVSRIEQNKKAIDIHTLKEIADKFQVSTDYLLGDGQPTNDKDKQFVCKYTGLSLNAIEKLNKTQFKDDDFSLDDIPSILVNDPITNLPLLKSFIAGDDIAHINLFIEDNNFYEFVRLLANYSKSIFHMEKCKCDYQNKSLTALKKAEISAELLTHQENAELTLFRLQKKLLYITDNISEKYLEKNKKYLNSKK